MSAWGLPADPAELAKMRRQWQSFERVMEGMRAESPATSDGGVPRWNTLDTVLEGVQPRGCSCCGREFKPTIRRRMLCDTCFRLGDGRREF